jgi:alpha-glucosidase (family GH31 glycosyl hydrolase)
MLVLGRFCVHWALGKSPVFRAWKTCSKNANLAKSQKQQSQYTKINMEYKKNLDCKILVTKFDSTSSEGCRWRLFSFNPKRFSFLLSKYNLKLMLLQ